MLWLCSKLSTVLLVMVMLMSSHSDWERIIVRVQLVLREEFTHGENCISLSEVGDKKKKTARFPCRMIKRECIYVFSQTQHHLRHKKTWTTNRNFIKLLNESEWLTAVYGRLEGEVAALNVKGEFVNIHLAGADHQHVVPKPDLTIIENN